MNWLDLLELGISTAEGALTAVNPAVGAAGALITKEIEAGLEALRRARAMAVTDANLEALRTKALW